LACALLGFFFFPILTMFWGLNYEVMQWRDGSFTQRAGCCLRLANVMDKGVV
jgi:hypothetical protein